ncbi:MAG: HD-GYP domain-containing protein [Bacillota bacterium]
MQAIPVEALKSGMILAKPIRREKDGLVLLQDKTVIKQLYIDKIKALNIGTVWVQEGQTAAEDEFIEPIREETRLKATALLRTTFSLCKHNETLDMERLRTVVKEILDYILGDPRIIYTITKINAYDNYTFTHSVDVCVLAVLIGSVMGLHRSELEILGISALLHDIGKTFIDFRILNKPAKLEPVEYEFLKTHTREGYELLKKRSNSSFLIPHMALQHHEREDGSGYPRGLQGKRIHRFAKIIAVADVFDAMTSLRIYRQPVPPALAIQEICGNTPFKFNQTVVDYFTKIVTPYTKGSILLLSNHQTVEIIFISRMKCLVKVVSAHNGGETFDLYQKPEITVLKRLN